MTDLSKNPAGHADQRSAPSTTASASHRPRSMLWRAIERVAGTCTTGELGMLADHYQVGQPALAARFRAALVAAQGHRA